MGVCRASRFWMFCSAPVPHCDGNRSGERKGTSRLQKPESAVRAEGEGAGSREAAQPRAQVREELRNAMLSSTAENPKARDALLHALGMSRGRCPGTWPEAIRKSKLAESVAEDSTFRVRHRSA